LTDDDFHVERVSADQLHGLRRRILRNDDPAIYRPDPRDGDETSFHYGGFLGARLVVSASFFPSAPPMNPSLVTFQLRYMATDFDVQGRGYGARVLAFAEEDLRALGASNSGPTVAIRRWASMNPWDGFASRVRSTSVLRQCCRTL